MLRAILLVLVVVLVLVCSGGQPCRLLRAGLEPRSMLRAILLVLVVVLVLDSLWGAFSQTVLKILRVLRARPSLRSWKFGTSQRVN